MAGASAPLSWKEVYENQAHFVWVCLQRLGIRDADLDDMLQEVFVVVYRRLGEFEGRAKLTTWLYAICRRVAHRYRKRAFRHREDAEDEHSVAQRASDGHTPESELVQQEAQAEVDELLAALDSDRRAVFVMYEIEELPGDVIATTLGIPIGTVYSRLHSARRILERVVLRERLRDRIECQPKKVGR